jgi:WD40 repeat protein/tRNA A-37 threonylcarbamoyl transferase component Bud32
MPNVECISDPELQAFLLGRLPKRIASAITDHLENCPACEANADRLDAQADGLIHSLRRTCRPGEPAASARCLPGPLATASLLGKANPTIVETDDSAASLSRCIAGYEILEELGRGGMGVVYKARQTHPVRLVALKMVLSGGHSDHAQRARLLAEADAIARLRHPHIVQVHEVGLHEGVPFLSLEYVDGESLDRKLRGEPQPPREAATLVESLARAVHHAHQHGVIHRDLKPANVLLTADRTPKVTDFGLAKQKRPDLTATGAILGTPSYMAPEQAAGDNRAVGPATDVYSLGAILYELMTGRPPFRGATPLETLDQVRTQEAVAPSQLQPKLPVDLSTICQQCLRKEPSRRYVSALALADDLRRFLDGKPVQARPVGPAERAWRWGRRNPGWAGMVGTITLLLLILAIGASVGNVWLSNALTESEANQKKSETNLTRAKRAERETEVKLFDTMLAQARGTSLSRRSGQRFVSLELLADAAQRARRLELPPERFLDLRNAVILALAVPDLRAGPSWDGCPDGTTCVDFAEDMTIYARADGGTGGCEIRRVADDKLLHRLPGLAPKGKAVDGPYLSPDGRFVAWQVGYHSMHWKLSGKEPERQFEEPGVLWVDYHPNGRQVALAHSNGTVSLYDLESGDLVRRLEAGIPKGGTFVALHPTEPLVAIAAYGVPVVQIRNLITGAVVTNLSVPASCCQVAWHPNGHIFAASEGNGTKIHLFDRVTWNSIRTMETAGGGGIRMAFDPTGGLLAAFTWANVMHVFDTATGKLLFQAPPQPTPMRRPRFSGDGRKLACCVRAGQLNLWDVDGAREYRTLLHQGDGTPSAYNWAGVGPDNRLLAAQMTSRVRFWDLATGQEMDSLPAEIHRDSAPLLTTNPCALVISNSAGVHRWPIRPREGDPATLQIGPPQDLTRTVAYRMDADRAGQVLVVAARTVKEFAPFAGAWVFRADHPDHPLRLDPGIDLANAGVSLDGRWAITAVHPRGLTKVWDTRDGRLVKTLEGWFPRFSSDGRWLAMSGDRGGLYHVGTWEPGLRFLGRAQFSPDSRLLAVSKESGVIHLLEIATGRELARLEDPNQEIDGFHVFTPDGTRLVTVSNGKEGGIHIWDLLAIRGKLKDMNLDWDTADYPPQRPASLVPLRIDVVTP